MASKIGAERRILLGVLSWDEVTRVEFKVVGCFSLGLADRFKRPLPADGFEVFGEIIC